MTAAVQPSFSEIQETFELIDDWEDRYRYLIDLGKALPGLEEARRTPATKVEGCASQVWLDIRTEATAEGGSRLVFEGDSDAHIVRGLIVVLTALLSGRAPEDIARSSPLSDLGALGLDAHLSAQRSNGLRAMLGRIEGAARAAL